MDKYLPFLNKAVQVNYQNHGSVDKRTGIVWSISPRKLTLMAFDDDFEIYVPIKNIKSIKEVKGG